VNPTVLTVIASIAPVLATVAAAVASYYTFTLNKQRIEFEKSAKTIQDEQRKVLDQMSQFGSQVMTQTLKVTPQFAFAPYSHLLPTVHPSDHSLFDRRRTHFSPEKEVLAEAAIEMIRKLVETKPSTTCALILDAGSTVFPIFRRLCLHPTFRFDRTNADRLKIITNNLPGVSELIRHGRMGDPISPTTLFECRVLRGFANSLYEASLSTRTSVDLTDAVNEFKESAGANSEVDCEIICVSTGNYISLPDGVLARDPNHQSVKDAMLKIAQHIYVLAPFGKLLQYNCQDINELLGYSDASDGYAALPNWESVSANLTMFVTSRPHEYFAEIGPACLRNHFAAVQDRLRKDYENRLVECPFDPLDDISVRVQVSLIGEERALREYELPHRNMRESLLAKLQ